MIQAFAFYLFAAVVVASGVMTIAARNPVHSVLWLILAFFNAAGLMLILGAEFIAMLLVIVYVGAVAVLFLFVVMMLDVDFAQLREGFAKYLPLGGVIAGLLAIEMIVVSAAVVNRGAASGVSNVQAPAADATNAEVIGRVLYTDFAFLFQAAGMVLLVSMIGAIVLTLRHRAGVKRQNIHDQVNRTRAQGVSVIGAASGGAAILSAVTGLSYATSFLALAPAGVTEMVLTARVMHLDTVSVTSFHVVRIAVIAATILLTFGLFDRLSRRIDGG